MGYIHSPKNPLGEIENLGMLLNLFVFLRAFASFHLKVKYLLKPLRGQLLFLGLIMRLGGKMNLHVPDQQVGLMQIVDFDSLIRCVVRYGEGAADKQSAGTHFVFGLAPELFHGYG